MSDEAVKQLLAGPALQPPLGQVSNLGGTYAQHFPEFITGAILVQTSTIAIVGVRIFTQVHILNGLVAEDVIVMIAALLHIGLDLSAFFCLRHDVGQHMWNISMQKFIDLSQAVYFAGLFYIPCVNLTKIAILLQIIRIFAPRNYNKRAWVVCCVCISVISGFTVVYMFFLIFQCTPVERAWNELKDGFCFDQAAIYLASGTFNMISDFVILVIPIPIILKLQMSSRKKLAVMVVFATGVFACAASVLRLYYTKRTFDSPDRSYHEYYLGIFAAVEAFLGILIFCLPILPQFYHFMRNLIRRRTHGNAVQPVGTTSPSSMEQALPKVSRQPYEMPSLASFERTGVGGPDSTTQLLPVKE